MILGTPRNAVGVRCDKKERACSSQSSTTTTTFCSTSVDRVRHTHTVIVKLTFTDV